MQHTLGLQDRAAGAEARPAEYPTPCPDMPVAPVPIVRLATAGWSNPSEQRARTGLNQFVSDAQSV